MITILLFNQAVMVDDVAPLAGHFTLITAILLEPDETAKNFTFRVKSWTEKLLDFTVSGPNLDSLTTDREQLFSKSFKTIFKL